MKKRHPQLVSDNLGASAVEFAIAVPLLFMLIFGIWNAGIALFAQNGVRSAVESGARHATIFPRPTEQQIKDVVMDRYYGPGQGQIEEPSLTYSLQNNSPVVTISMSYTHETSLPFLKLPPIVLEHRRTAYLAPVKGSGS